MPRLLEIACFNERSAAIAQAAGADRVELCINYKEGGLSPAFTMIEAVRKTIRLPLVVMLRPRPGNFIYTRPEFESLKAQIEFCKRIKVDGLVFGAITKDGDVDKALCEEVLRLGEPLNFCFHRAIDQCREPERQLETLIELGFRRVLTSGAKTNATEGKNKLLAWQKRFGSKIVIMPGGGLRSENIEEILQETTCREFHSAAIVDESETASTLEIERMANILHNS